jgi:hypothetical protein
VLADNATLENGGRNNPVMGEWLYFQS